MLTLIFTFQSMTGSITSIWRCVPLLALTPHKKGKKTVTSLNHCFFLLTMRTRAQTHNTHVFPFTAFNTYTSLPTTPRGGRALEGRGAWGEGGRRGREEREGEEGGREGGGVRQCPILKYIPSPPSTKWAFISGDGLDLISTHDAPEDDEGKRRKDTVRRRRRKGDLSVIWPIPDEEEPYLHPHLPEADHCTFTPVSPHLLSDLRSDGGLAAYRHLHHLFFIVHQS